MALTNPKVLSDRPVISPTHDRAPTGRSFEPEAPPVDLVVFRAADNPAVAAQFEPARAQALKRHDVEFPEVRPYQGYEVFYLLAMAMDTMAGGLRLHRATEILPMERELGSLIPSHERDCTAELAGYFVSTPWRRTGLAEDLLRAAIQHAPFLRLNRIVLFGHQYVVPLYTRFGWRLWQPYLDIPYPDPRYLSSAMSLDVPRPRLLDGALRPWRRPMRPADLHPRLP